MQAVLVMFRSDGERRSFSITRDVTVIGRREDCDLRIPLGDISRKHARLIKEDGQLRLEDLGSSNGTHLNGQRIERDAVLQAGDSIQVGPVVFVLQMDGYPADDELNPITAESAAAAAMFAPSALPTAPGAPLAEDPTLDLGGYEQGGEESPAEFAEEEQYAQAGELEGLDELPAAEPNAEEFEPLSLDDAASLELEEPATDEEPLEFEESESPVPLHTPALSPAPEPEAPTDELPLALDDEEPMGLAPEEPLALADEEPLALADEEPLALADDEPLALADEEPLSLVVEENPLELADEDPLGVADDGSLELLEDPDAPQPVEEELMIDFDEPEKK
ncbi:FHA domain-containing protein [Humisphaera borealis]|uniref:FHA domain-containing protein n=1 Tax=Humisphaera borealis TaxID=2807512 RepID=A0A7M2WXP5_9BACT|nr:FHA domain-containing protein [Humisphaera borealis]QOV90124.1 FHA domain-containing protein [Humisphaera borealis]